MAGRSNFFLFGAWNYLAGVCKLMAGQGNSI